MHRPPSRKWPTWASSKEHAIELAKRFLAVVGEGESEIHLMHDVPAFESGPAYIDANLLA
jgi:hypothetical protein